ncbi:hypothetical protein N7509_007476 [Penicillium cosmopolitanum]|uniref:Uncharacterized protein n=1 Tax=Penicillium cosmopolitanum TaxID=1131564 RepID=A0A9X0B8G9_9EURO|nr:uncharacterized protein N7509_007476 [Penicillium cosmopolitanum]KAJ5391986.1 hypothetical protein N7509_007476 [Penicillium cosmopolitanum]
MALEDQRGQPARTRRVRDEQDPGLQTTIPEEPNEEDTWSDDANCGDMPSKPGNRHRKPKNDPISNSRRHRQREPVLPPKLSKSRKEKYANDPGSFEQAGGQAVPYGRPGFYGHEPFVPLSQPAPPPVSTQYPPNPYLPNRHSFFQHPMGDPTTPISDQYMNSHPGVPPPYPYPMNPGPYSANIEPQTFFPDPGHHYLNYPHIQPQPVPSFEGMPMAGKPPQTAAPSTLERELEETRRELDNMIISQKRERRALKKQNEAAAQKEAKRDSEARNVERLVREEISKVLERERRSMDFETQSEPVRARAGDDIRGYPTPARHAHDDMQYSNERLGEWDQLREEIAQLVEGRRQYLSQRVPSRGSPDAPARTKLQVRPRTAFGPVNDQDFRDRVEDVVIDLLRSLRSNDDESEWLPSLSSPYRTMSDGYPAREGQQRPRNWQTGTYGSRPINPVIYSSTFAHERKDDAKFSGSPRDFEAHQNVPQDIGNRGYPTNTGQNGGTWDRRNSGRFRGLATAGRQVENSDRLGGPRYPEMPITYHEGFPDELDDQEFFLTASRLLTHLALATRAWTMVLCHLWHLNPHGGIEMFLITTNLDATLDTWLDKTTIIPKRNMSSNSTCSARSNIQVTAS